MKKKMSRRSKRSIGCLTRCTRDGRGAKVSVGVVSLIAQDPRWRWRKNKNQQNRDRYTGRRGGCARAEHAGDGESAIPDPPHKDKHGAKAAQ